MRTSDALCLAAALALALVAQPSVMLASPEHENGALGIEYRSSEWKNEIVGPGYRKFELFGVQNGSSAVGILKGGDIIYSLDGKLFPSDEEFRDYIASRAPGTEIVISYRRPSEKTVSGLLGNDARLKLVGKAALASPIRTPCDDLAANPKDVERVTPGVKWEQLNGHRARAACEEALRTYSHPRLFYQYGRALEKAGQVAAALVPFRQAYQLGHVEAAFDISAIWSARRDLVSDCELREMSERQIAKAHDSTQSHINRAVVLISGHCGPESPLEASHHADLAARYAGTARERAQAQDLRATINAYLSMRVMQGAIGSGSSSEPEERPGDRLRKHQCKFNGVC